MVTKILLENFQLPNGQVLDNRFFKSAMSETMADSQGAPSDDLIALYDFWTKQGMGVLVTGNVMVDGRYLGEPGNVVLDSDAHLAPAQSPWQTDVSVDQSNSDCTQCHSDFWRLSFGLSSTERNDRV